jgi:hypothetical protein
MIGDMIGAGVVVLVGEVVVDPKRWRHGRRRCGVFLSLLRLSDRIRGNVRERVRSR